MKNKSCVIFACAILSKDRLFVLHEFLECFKNSFKDSNFYIGINHNCVEGIEDIILNSGIQVKRMERAAETLYTESDASAYQKALYLLKESKIHYENCWFVHTKSGVNSHSDYLRTWYIENFLSEKPYIENFLDNYPSIGSYGMLAIAYNANRQYSEKDTEIPLFENIIKNPLNYTHANFFYIHTLYTIKGEVVDKFLELVTNVWFNSKLNKYYFEGIFPFVVSRLGYFPYVSNGLDIDGVDIKQLNMSWIRENNLQKHRKLINLHRTNYEFNQLNPPSKNTHVNSYA